MVKFNIALEPTVLQIPFCRRKAVQDLCQSLCYLSQLPFSFTSMQVSLVKTPKTSRFCLPAFLPTSAQKRSNDRLQALSSQHLPPGAARAKKSKYIKTANI